MIKLFAAGASLALVLASGGCPEKPAGVKDDPKDPGTVNRLISGKVVSKQDNGTAKYTIRVQSGGPKDPITVIPDANREEFLRCNIGDRWPDCRKK